MLILLKTPLTSNYSSFLEECIQNAPRDTHFFHVIVLDPIAKTSHLNLVLSTLYTQMREFLNRSGFGATTPVDVLYNLSSQRLYARKHMPIFVEASEPVPQELVDAQVSKIPSPPISRDLQAEDAGYEEFSFATVAVGGTFDHLHDGHKILLSIASFVTKTKLIVGVTGPELLKNKKYASMIQSLDYRIAAVSKFLGEVFQNHQTYVMYQINDICGPTGYIADIEALVISEETLQGAKFVNEYRQKIDMPPLAVIAAKVLGGNGNADNNWQGKLSSTDLRKAEYESRPPVKKSRLG